jgi:parvulin-like peptidyl-prolyl isomerase
MKKTAKRNLPRQEKETVLTAKQIARARRESKARRQIFIASGVLTAIVVAVLGVGLVSELIVKPGQPVASVGDIEISTAEFQERVRLERGQRISFILQYAELFGVEQVYGIAAQLDEHETLGEQVLDTMVNEVLIRRAAAEIPLRVSDEEVTIIVEEQEAYYRSGTPTPLPTFTPRPSPTPITATDTLPTPFPSITPRPSPTVVTQDAFEDLFRQRLRAMETDEDTYRGAIEMQLLIEKVRAWLMEDVPLEEDQVQLDMLLFTTEEKADEYLARLEAGESFDDLVGQVRGDPDSEGIDATSVLWTPFEELAADRGITVAQFAFPLPVGTHSPVVEISEGEYMLLQVTGHEQRELSSRTLSRREENLYTSWLEGLLESAKVEKHEYWRSRIPRTPTLDPRLLIPTPTPEG